MSAEALPGARPVRTLDDRARVLDVLQSVYCDEKDWGEDLNAFFPESDLNQSSIAWFLADSCGKASGVIRAVFELPVDYFQQYDFEFIDADLPEQLANYRIAEVGRFAVKGPHRTRILIAASLMRAVANAAIEGGCTHLITDVLEDDPDSPHRFHSRVLGFETIASHEHGPSCSSSRRLTMLLDLAAAYRRMAPKNQWLCRHITKGWKDDVRQQLAGSAT